MTFTSLPINTEQRALVTAARRCDNVAWTYIVERYDRVLRNIARSYQALWPAAALGMRSVILVIACCLLLPAGAAQAAPADPVIDPQELALCQQINTYRAQNGRAPLKLSIALTRAARWLSSDMASNDFFDHDDSLGRGFSRRLTVFGYRGATRGENVAGGATTATETLQQWKASAPHRRNMLNRAYKVLGVGHAYGADTMLGWYWATTFGGTIDRAVAC